MKVGIVVEFEAKLLKSSIFKVKVVKVQLDVFLMQHAWSDSSTFSLKFDLDKPKNTSTLQSRVLLPSVNNLNLKERHKSSER